MKHVQTFENFLNEAYKRIPSDMKISGKFEITINGKTHTTKIAGFERVKYIDKILYLYNIHNPISDHMKNQQLQWDINNEINNKKKFKIL